MTLEPGRSDGYRRGASALEQSGHRDSSSLSAYRSVSTGHTSFKPGHDRYARKPKQIQSISGFAASYCGLMVLPLT